MFFLHRPQRPHIHFEKQKNGSLEDLLEKIYKGGAPTCCLMNINEVTLRITGPFSLEGFGCVFGRGLGSPNNQFWDPMILRVYVIHPRNLRWNLILNDNDGFQKESPFPGA